MFYFVHFTSIAVIKRFTIIVVCSDDQLCHDVDVLLSCLKLIAQSLKGDPENFFEQDLYYAVADPVQMATDFADYVLRNSRLVNCMTTVNAVMRRE